MKDVTAMFNVQTAGPRDDIRKAMSCGVCKTAVKKNSDVKGVTAMFNVQTAVRRDDIRKAMSCWV